MTYRRRERAGFREVLTLFCSNGNFQIYNISVDSRHEANWVECSKELAFFAIGFAKKVTAVHIIIGSLLTATMPPVGEVP